MSENKENILIVEDEYTIAMNIEMRLQKMGYKVCGIAGNYNEALKALLENNIDLALLDINLKDSKTGIDIGKIIAQKFNIPIVFLTAFSDKKTFSEALEAKPFGFVTKPVKDTDLHNTIQLALINFSQKKNKPENSEYSQSFKIENKSIFVKDKGILYQVNFDDIYYLEAMDNYTILYCKMRKHIVNGFLKDIIKDLGENFVRIHKSHAVAINKINSIQNNLLHIGNTQLTIGKTYKTNLLEKLKII